MNYKELILILMESESDPGCQLDLLTSIEITTTNDEVYDACIEIRNEFISDSDSKRKAL